MKKNKHLRTAEASDLLSRKKQRAQGKARDGGGLRNRRPLLETEDEDRMAKRRLRGSTPKVSEEEERGKE